jgi:predicted Fe-Mo cluster-binding NifX family protein
MKIALITDDGKTISQHFGRAPYYLVVSIEEGKVTGQEMRDKPSHTHFANEKHEEHEHQPGEQHGFDSQSRGRHNRMGEVIKDCQVLICGGMGMGAYEGMKTLNITPIVTDLNSVEEAIQAFLVGNLQDHTEKLH